MIALRIAALAAAALVLLAVAPATIVQASVAAPHAKPLHPRPAPSTGDNAQAGAAAGGQLSLQTSGTQGVVSPTPKVYLVFWGSQWSSDPAGVANDMQAMFRGLYGSADTWGTILSQYCENAP